MVGVQDVNSRTACSGSAGSNLLTVQSTTGFSLGDVVLELGLYNRALNLMNAPMNVITTGFQSVLFSACARAQDSPAL